MSTTTNCTNWMNWSIYILFDYSNCSQLKCIEWKTIHANQCSLFVSKFVCRMVCAPNFPFFSSLKLYTMTTNGMKKLIFAIVCVCVARVCVSRVCMCVRALMLLVDAVALLLLLLLCRALLYIHLAPFTFAYARPISQSENTNGCIKCKAIVCDTAQGLFRHCSRRHRHRNKSEIKSKRKRKHSIAEGYPTRNFRWNFSVWHPKCLQRNENVRVRCTLAVKNLVKYLCVRILAYKKRVYETKTILVMQPVGIG